MSNGTENESGVERGRGIDPRGPRFGASITSVLLLVTVFLGLTGLSTQRGESGSQEGWRITDADFVARLTDPGFILLLILTALFAWGAIAGIQRHPYAAIFRTVVRPRLSPPTELENPVPPTFAQGIGFVVTALGVVLHLAGVPLAIPIAAGVAFVAAFLNAAFGYCLGCQIYLLIARARVGSTQPA